MKLPNPWNVTNHWWQITPPTLPSKSLTTLHGSNPHPHTPQAQCPLYHSLLKTRMAHWLQDCWLIKYSTSLALLQRSRSGSRNPLKRSPRNTTQNQPLNLRTLPPPVMLTQWGRLQEPGGVVGGGNRARAVLRSATQILKPHKPSNHRMDPKGSPSMQVSSPFKALAQNTSFTRMESTSPNIPTCLSSTNTEFSKATCSSGQWNIV